MKDKKIINPKVLDLFDCEWWLSKTFDEDTKQYVYAFEYGVFGKNNECIECKSANELALKIGVLITRNDERKEGK